MQKLLLVDDEKSVLSALKRNLMKQPFEVFTAESANDAYEILATNDIQVMMTDFKMPNESGAELIANVSSSYPEVVSLMLSGQADYEQVVDLMSSKSIVKFIKKPWLKSDLVNAVRQAFTHYHQMNHSSWQQRLNTSSFCKAQHEFERLLAVELGKKQKVVICLLNLTNTTDISEKLGQKACEKLQSDMISNAHATLPTGCFSYWNSPSSVVFCFPGFDHDTCLEILTKLRSHIVRKARQHSPSIQLDMRIAYRTIDKCFTTLEFLLEELKQNLNTTNAFKPTLNIDTELSEKLARERLIRTSISEQLNDGKFSLAVQPKIDLSTNLVDSAEVLLRWEHSTLGWLSPEEFIRLAEIDGQITELGSWVVDRSVALAAMMSRTSPTLKSISINLSSRQLYSDSLVSQLKHVIDKYDVDPQKIELEITETCIAQDIEKVIPMMTSLKQLGVGISMDDFGAGSTAYNYLAELPLDILKLDRCLIKDLSASKNKQTLVSKLIECCHSIGIRVVAEGVEDHDTLDILRLFKCDIVQGYVFSPAISPAKFTNMMLQQPFK